LSARRAKSDDRVANGDLAASRYRADVVLAPGVQLQRARRDHRMKPELILLVVADERVRAAVATSLAQAGSYVEPCATLGEAIEFLVLFRPDWILVDEIRFREAMAWLAAQERHRDVPVVLLPDLGLTPPPGFDPRESERDELATVHDLDWARRRRNAQRGIKAS
jgi:hypothetical protein